MANKILNLLSKGMITLGATTGKDEYVLFVVGADKQFAIPFIKTKSATFAYIDDSIAVEDYAGLANIIDAINANKVYKGIYAYKPISKKAPEHSHIIKDIIPGGIDGAKSVQPKNLDKIIKVLGYDRAASADLPAAIERDYSELLKEPENMANFEKDAAELKKVGATYEGLSPEIKTAYEAISAGHSSGLILEGPTGTGKSFAIDIMANHAGAPLLGIQITGGTTEDHLLGNFIPNGEGGFDFVEGPLLKAYYKGYWLKLDEINFGSAPVIAVVNQFTDGTNRVTVNGKTYHRHPNFVICMTMNPGYEGTDPLNVALKNRFAKVDVPALTKKEFCARAMAYSKGLGHQLSFDFFSKVYDFAAFIEKEANSSKWHENAKFSVRNAQRLCDAILMKKRSFDEFFAAMSIEYMNDLSTDNDNSDKLQQFKKEKDVIEQVRAIYELYDFAEVKSVDITDTLDSFFTEDPDEESSESDSKKSSDKMVDDLMSRFDL